MVEWQETKIENLKIDLILIRNSEIIATWTNLYAVICQEKQIDVVFMSHTPCSQV